MRLFSPEHGLWAEKDEKVGDTIDPETALPVVSLYGEKRRRPSCEKKRQLLWAEWLCKEVLAPVSHRHVVLTTPRLLRPLFRRRRELLTELGRAAAEATTELVRRGLGHGARPGLVVSIATAGDLVQWHPHLHLLVTDGGKAADGSWQPLPEWNATLLMSLFRESLLARLVLAHAISPELVKKSETPSRSRSSSTSTAARPSSTAPA